MRKNSFCKFAIFNNHKEEDHVQANERVISIDNLGLSFSTLLSWFIADKMSISHLPAEIAEVNTFGLDRMIFDFVAFEKTYIHLYPEKEERSEDYLIIKTRVIEKIEEIKASASGRHQKEAAKSLKNAVEKSDNALHIRIKRAIERHKEILDPFLFHEYGEEYEAAIECICKRMASLRNNIAHGNFGLVIKPENHTDLHILEIILYVMRLNKLGLDKKTIQNSILDLFKLNMYIPDDNDVCVFPEEQESN